MNPEARPSQTPGWKLRRMWVETALGRLLVVASESGLCHLGLDPDHALTALGRWAGRIAPCVEVLEEPTAMLAEAAGQLVEYGRGQLRRLELPLDLRGTDFQRAVWRELTAIPYGTTSTYGEIAARLGHPGASHAVGRAAGNNPVPLVVPCHRLLASRGLGGFSGGLERKRALLVLEGILPGVQKELGFGAHPGG